MKAQEFLQSESTQLQIVLKYGAGIQNLSITEVDKMFPFIDM